MPTTSVRLKRTVHRQRFIDVMHAGSWLRAQVPSAETPFWSNSVDGSPLSIQTLYLGDPKRRATLEQAHAEAVRDLLLAAFAAKVAGEHALARELFTRAGRLCTEPLGHCPPGQL